MNSNMMNNDTELLERGRRVDDHKSFNNDGQLPGEGPNSIRSPEEGGLDRVSNRPRGLRLFLVMFALLLTMFLVSTCHLFSVQ